MILKLGILIVFWTAFYLGVDAAPRYNVRCLERISRRIKLTLPDSLGAGVNNDTTWSYAGKRLRIRTNLLGDVSHIGYCLFSAEYIEKSRLTPLFDFLERYALELDLLPATQEERELFFIRHKYVVFLEGDSRKLRERRPDLPFTVNMRERRGFRIEWGTAKDRTVMELPADYQMLHGADQIELENGLERDIGRMASVIPLQCPQHVLSPDMSECLSVENAGCYLDQLIRSDLYMMQSGGCEFILVDSTKPLQSVRNILLTGCSEHELRLNLTLDKYGYEKSRLQITYQQFINFCNNEACKLYLGIKTKTRSKITATLFAVNAPMAYNHMLVLDFPLKILAGEMEEIKGTLYAYTPLQNVTEKFFMNLKN